jgi:serine protease Do
VIWSNDGIIVTNAHVARGGQIKIQLWDGREFNAIATSRDSHRDIAALRIEASDLAPAVSADSSLIRSGELAIAIGNPLGFVGALTSGVIQAVGPIPRLSSQSWVQAGVRLAPGNSGGPLADARGRVIGINTMVAGDIALAIPSNDVRDFLSFGPSSAWLGVTVSPVKIPRTKDPGGNSQMFGLVLLEVEPGSPASSASLLPGDILLGTEQRSFTSPADLSQTLQVSAFRPVRLKFLRGDYSRVRRVTVQFAGQHESRRSVAA